MAKRFKLPLELNIFQFFRFNILGLGAQARMTNLTADLERMPKDFFTYANACVSFKTSFEFSFLLAKSQLQFHLNAGRLIESFIWSNTLYRQICRYFRSGPWTNKLCIFRLQGIVKYKAHKLNVKFSLRENLELINVVACARAYADGLSSSPNHLAEIR